MCHNLLENAVSHTIKTPDWVKDAVFYQIFPDRFATSERVTKPSNLEAWDSPPTPRGFKGGDLLGVAEHLDHLENLGITAIYFNPIFQSASNHRYHTHDYYQVDPLLGGNAALRELVDAAHARGINVVLDGVFNHASRGFFQFNHILECGEQSPYLDWFTVKGLPLNAYDHEQAPNYGAWLGLHALPELNTTNPQVRAFIWDIAEYWVKFGIDGWRLDVPYEIDDDAFWQEFRRRVKGANPEAYIVGEIWHESQRWLQGDQYDAVMNYIQTRAAMAFFGARSLAPLYPGGGFDRLQPLDAAAFAKTIDDMLALYDWEITMAQLNLLGSHDTARFITMVQDNKSALKLAMLFQMTMPGAPMVYYGDEIGLSGGYEPASRGAMPWDRAQWDMDLLDYVRQTIRVRKAHPALRRGTYRTLLAEGELYAFERKYETQRLVVAFNTAAEAKTLDVPLGQGAAHAHAVFGDAQHVVLHGTTVTINAPPRTGFVIGLE
ncbi:MAG: glycoside hydrolase family 13 protein [Anaerolineae bacterium]|nr:glycoside hydrolase family 13 protein [Anaerolineae bacterium]